jgi:hypothetical protein
MNDHVAGVMKQYTKEKDPEVWVWLNRLRILCIQLGDCDD